MKLVTESQASREMTYNVPSRERKSAVNNYTVDEVLSSSTTERRQNVVSLDTQISKFYRKYGENWMEKFYRNQEAEI